MFKIQLMLLLAILASVCVNAFAVSRPHLTDDTIVLYPGEGSDFELILQNMQGDNDELAQVVITEGNEIARITDKENIYKVPKGTKDTKVRIRIDIPNDAPLGTEYSVRYSANLVTGGQGGMVQVAQGLSDGFKVRIGPIPEQKPLMKEKSPINVLWLIGGLILVILIVLGLVYYKKYKK